MAARPDLVYSYAPASGYRPLVSETGQRSWIFRGSEFSDGRSLRWSVGMGGAGGMGGIGGVGRVGRVHTRTRSFTLVMSRNPSRPNNPDGHNRGALLGYIRGPSKAFLVVYSKVGT